MKMTDSRTWGVTRLDHSRWGQRSGKIWLRRQYVRQQRFLGLERGGGGRAAVLPVDVLAHHGHMEKKRGDQK